MTRSPHNAQSSQSQDIAVVIRVGNGSFADGFPVNLEILEGGRTIEESEPHDGLRMPAAANMRALFEAWQAQSFEGSRRLQARLTPVEAQPTNISDIPDQEQFANWQAATKALRHYCETWFSDQDFGRLRDRILTTSAIQQDPSVPIVIRCDQNNPDRDILHRLPFHLWDLYLRLPNSEFALFTKYAPVQRLQKPVKVLAIFGTAKGLNLEQDEDALITSFEQRGAHIRFEKEPTPEALSRLLSDEAWDILFFAGHSSSTEMGGRLKINQDTTLALENLGLSLTHAVSKGLKLAIFNSCDGLGLSTLLTKVGVPNIVVMKEPIADDIAGQFLIEFLEDFTGGTQLCQAIRRARRILQSYQERFPAASWLPVVCLNPSAPELVLPTSPPTQQRRHAGRLQLILGLAVLAGLVSVVTPPILSNRCQLLPVVFKNCPAEQDIIIANFISYGEKPVEDSKVQLSGAYGLLKQEGIEAFADGNYEDAVNLFDTLRDQARQNKSQPDTQGAALAALQDPEVLIYRNNAFVRARHAENPESPLYTVAIAAPLNNDAGMSIVLGFAQAHDVAVKQGVNLQVVIANDSNRRDQARQIAENLSKDKQVLAVVGHYTSPNTCAALNVYSDNNLVVIAPTSTMVNLPSNQNCGGDPNKVFFRTVSSTRVEAQTLIGYLVNDLKQTQPRVVAFYNPNELFSNDMFEQFEQVLTSYGGELIAAFDLSDPKLQADQLPPQVSQADAIAILPDGGTDSDTALQKAVDFIKLNDGDKPILGANTLYLQKVINEGQDTLVDRLFIAVDWHPQQCGAETFSQQVREYWGGDLNRRTALAYEALQVIVSKLPAAPASKVTRGYIRQKLSETGITEGAAPQSDVLAGQTISFDARGDRREITTRAIVTVNDQLRFALAKDDNCPGI